MEETDRGEKGLPRQAWPERRPALPTTPGLRPARPQSRSLLHPSFGKAPN